MSVYNLCYCLQSLLLFLHAKTSSLQQSKNATAKCTETLLPPPCIQFSLIISISSEVRNVQILS